MSEQLFGRIENIEQTEKILQSIPMPYLGPVGQAICGTGEGKIQLLYKFVEAVTPNGQYPVREQAIGDCVSHGYAGGVDCLTAAEIAMGDDEQWAGEACSEYIYGVSRVLIGNGSLGRSDGSIGAWAAKGLAEYGCILKKKYGKIDLSTYNGSVAKQYGYSGPSKELIVFGKEHPIKTYSQVRTVEECRDSIVNLYPVMICSNQGFTSIRDKDGFARASGSWPHCMLVSAVDANSSRMGFLIQNSWGRNWITGPKKLEQPDGSFWCDYDTMAKILRQNDSWSISNYQGYKRQDLSWETFLKAREKAKDYE